MVRSRDGRWQAVCAGCGVQFSPARARQRYHSRECAEGHRDEWAKPRGGTRTAAGLDTRVCLNPDCPRGGEPFQPLRASQLTCSRQCRDALPENRAKQRDRDSHPERRERQNELRRPSSPMSSPSRIETQRRANRKQQLSRYGITPDDYERMWAEQGGKCMLCSQRAKPGGIRAASRLHVDHDHATGYRRDLLCNDCNVGLGKFRDDPVLLRAAADYIERHRVGVT